MIVGYARVSTHDQSLDIQIAKLTASGCDKVFSERATGTNSQRDQLQAALQFVREGDTLLVTRLDRFARSQCDLHNMVRLLLDKGVGFRCTEQAGIDTTTSMGKLLIGVLASVAEFETDIRRERQREGIEAAKARGTYKGGTACIDHAKVRALLSEGMGPGAVAKELGCSRMTVHRASRSG